VIEQVGVEVEGESERVQVRIEWVGGHRSEGMVQRPVARLDQLSYYPALCARVRELSEAKYSAKQIAEQLNAEGFRPPKRREHFGAQGVLELQKRLGLRAASRGSAPPEGLADDEWWIPTLARELRMPEVTLYTWIRRGWVRARREEEAPRRWIIVADAAELASLRERRQRPNGYYTRRHWVEGPGSSSAREADLDT
jgi:hypothetical protein